MCTKNNEKVTSGFALFESHLVVVPINSWWIYIEASVHVMKFLQGFVKEWQPSYEEVVLVIRNRESKCFWIGTVRIFLVSGFFFFFFWVNSTVFVPSMRRSLISFSRLDKLVYSYSSGYGCFIQVFNLLLLVMISLVMVLYSWMWIYLFLSILNLIRFVTLCLVA